MKLDAPTIQDTINKEAALVEYHRGRLSMILDIKNHLDSPDEAVPEKPADVPATVHGATE